MVVVPQRCDHWRRCLGELTSGGLASGRWWRLDKVISGGGASGRQPVVVVPRRGDQWWWCLEEVISGGGALGRGPVGLDGGASRRWPVVVGLR